MSVHRRPRMATLEKAGYPLLLPADIEYSILLRLPVKSLTRFKSVCKPWSSLISSPLFHQHHYHHHSQNTPLLLTIRNDVLDPLARFLCFSTYHNTKDGALIHNFPKPAPDNYFLNYRIWTQSCQGLVCLPSWVPAKPIIICNPATQEMMSLPPGEGFDQCVGFGYSASSHELRVARFFVMDDESYCEVFTLGDTVWRESTAPSYIVNRGSAPFLHGAFHLLPCSWYGVRQDDYIAAFDIETEEYREIQFPVDYYDVMSDEDNAELDIVRLTELGGSLCLTINMSDTQVLVMWLLKDYANAGWVRAYNINVSIVGYPTFDIWSYPVGMMGDGSILLNVSKEHGRTLLCYDPRDGTVTMNIDEELSATFYVESFKCLGSR